MSYTNGLDKPSDYFEAFAYTGDGNTKVNFTSDFTPDMTWFKVRNNTYDHQIHDSVRGVNAGYLDSATTVVEQSSYPIASFDSDGVTTVSGNITGVNKTSDLMCSFNWKAGTSFTNDASGTGIGSIDSAGSANQDAGFSICTYTNTNTNTIKHGLNVVPDVIIAKTRGVSGYWFLGSEKMLGSWNKKLNLNTTGAVATETRPFYPGSVAPTSTVFSSDQSVFGAGGSATETMVAYCFAEKQGYSKFGSYTGNGSASSGTFIYTGFKPSFFLQKKSSAAGNYWNIWGYTSASGSNPIGRRLFPNVGAVESNQDGSPMADFCSNGVKLRQTDSDYNGSGATYIYMAFAENPFVTSTGVPATAR